MKLKEGITLYPFGASNPLSGEVTRDVAEWLIGKGEAEKSDFEVKAKKPAKKKVVKPAAPIVEAPKVEAPKVEAPKVEAKK